MPSFNPRNLASLAQDSQIKTELAQVVGQVPGVKAILAAPGLKRVLSPEDTVPIELHYRTFNATFNVQIYLQVGLETAAKTVGNQVYQQVKQFLEERLSQQAKLRIRLQILRISD